MSIVERALGKLRQGQPVPQPGAARAPQAAPATLEPLSARGSDPKQLPPPEARCVHIDHDALRVAGLLAPKGLEDRLANEYRRIKRPLISNALGKGNSPRLEGGNLIVVTSAVPGEGKTFTAINLALSMVLEPDIGVLLVDCDVAKPHVSRLFGLADEPGLIELLAGEKADLSEVMVHTDIPGLRLLPAGARHEHATELLASNRMEMIVTELGERYPDRIAIFDSPPLLATSESPVLANLMGQRVVVVHAGNTSQPALLGALELLDPAKPISLVLNKSRYSTGADYYGGYYGYGYGYGD